MAGAPQFDLELLATGTSERFRDRCRAKSGHVEHLDHAIAPSNCQNGEDGGAKRAKVAHSGRKSGGAGLSFLTRHRGLVAPRDLIYVNEKRAVRVGPEQKHKLNHPTDGPMKRSAVGVSG